MFNRLSTDGHRSPGVPRNLFAGPEATACWMIGGGPSLAALPVDEILSSPCPRFAVNLAGCGLLRPHFWTAYDPTARFHRSIYRDASIMKFVHVRRGMDLVPGTNFKVCDCPNLQVFDRTPPNGQFAFPGASPDRIVDWQDSLIQAIDIAWHLGFRKLYLAGCDLQIAPSSDLVQTARERGVAYRPGELLKEFATRCRQAGVTIEREDVTAAPEQYHFDERKPFAAAVNTDQHYFRVVQWLRLSRRNLALAGMELISVTPGSRLNAFFPYRDVQVVADEIRSHLGDPRNEPTCGQYTAPPKAHPDADLMRDCAPLSRKPNPPQGTAIKDRGAGIGVPQRQHLLEHEREVPIDLDEAG